MGKSAGVDKLLARHLAVAAVGSLVISVFWQSRPQWSAEMRLWKAVGDASLILLVITLAIGPAARLWRPVSRALPWRRETGIWFAVLATIHTVLIVHGWARWSVSRFLGYEFVAPLGRDARMEPGFGLANLVGLVALMWALVLAATSSDRALRRLGPSAWKWLHNGAQVIFYLVVLHVAYFLFIHYTASFHRAPPPPDWFRLPFLLLSLALIGLQAAAFVRTVRRRNVSGEETVKGRSRPVGRTVAAARRQRSSAAGDKAAFVAGVPFVAREPSVEEAIAIEEA